MSITATTIETSGLLGALPLFSFLLAAVVLLRWSHSSKAIIKPQLDQLEHELDLIRSQVLLVTTDNLVGFRIVKTIGYVEALSPTEAASDWEYCIAEKDALLRLAQKARSVGGNAVIGLRKTTAHYDQVGSRWRVSRVTYSGTAVIRKN